jgi:hypothetical protein
MKPNQLDSHSTPTPAQWKSMFCGFSTSQKRLMHVYLHEEKTPTVESQVAFDIDSFLSFASSLAVARQGLWYQPAPQMRQNITTDVHLETNIFRQYNLEQDARPSLAMLRDVPHFLLGRIVGANEISLHVLFPHLVLEYDKFVFLQNKQLSRWLNEAFLPAINKYCEAHITQHFPASYEHALANSRAHQVEGRLIETASYQT